MMPFLKRCACCSKIMTVIPSRVERTKYCSKYCQNEGKVGKRVSPATEFKKGNRPQSHVPIGSLHIAKGYMRVKITEPNIWRQRSHIVWEEVNGESLPKGWIVRHIDGDPLNDAPENLKAMPRSQHLIETLKDPAIEKHTREQVRIGSKRRWKKYHEKKQERYDTYYWQTELELERLLDR